MKKIIFVFLLGLSVNARAHQYDTNGDGGWFCNCQGGSGGFYQTGDGTTCAQSESACNSCCGGPKNAHYGKKNDVQKAPVNAQKFQTSSPKGTNGESVIGSTKKNAK